MDHDTWRHASLSLAQPGWPGIRKAEWVAATSRGELFRHRDLLAALDLLGDDGWELVAFAPEWADRSASYVFRRREPAGG